MAQITANITIEEITAQTTYSNKTSLAILNSHATDGLRVRKPDGNYVVLASGQSLSISAPTGTVLPDITILTDDTNLSAEIVAV